jgi:hypothetical protein
MTNHAAIYLGVSTDGQTVDNQRPELERLAVARRLAIVATYVESASATRRRPVFERMMSDAKRGAFDELLVWSLDRFGRSMAGNVNDALALDRAGVELLSVREPWLDTGGPVRDLLLAIFSWVAEQELRRLVERPRAGIERLERPSATASAAEAMRLTPNILSVKHWNRLLGGLLYAVSPRVDWATLLRRSFEVDVLRCTACGGRLRMLGEITEFAIVKLVLESIGVPTEAPLLSRARDPTELVGAAEVD